MYKKVNKNNINKKFNIIKFFKVIVLFIICLILYIYTVSIEFLPNKITIIEGNEFKYKILKGINLKYKNNEDIYASNNFNIAHNKNNNKFDLEVNLFNKINLKNIELEIIPKKRIIVCGNLVGFKLYTKGVLVIGVEDFYNRNKTNDINQGDIILEINDNKVNSINDLIKNINESKGEKIKVKYLSNNKILSIEKYPKKIENKYKLGLWVRDSAAGIGTLTFYDKETNKFMTLGHGLSDIDTGEIFQILKGELVGANIISIKRGVKGIPGEIRGSINNDKKIGIINLNSKFGVGGNSINKDIVNSKNEFDVGLRNDIKQGKASVFCQVNNKVEKFDIEIQKIFKENNNNNKSMFIKIIDKELIDKTGGIIQGMSGAPIIQNNKFVGAITNVLINDPRYGYAVFADKMIQEMNK